MEGLRLRDDSRFGGGFTRPHQTVCLHWNICFCLKVRIAELLMGSFLMGFPVFLLNSHTSYNIIEIISNNGYICWIWLFWDSFSLFLLHQSVSINLVPWNVGLPGRGFRRARHERWKILAPSRMGVGTVSQNCQNSHDSAAFQCYQKGIQESSQFFLGKKMVEFGVTPWWPWKSQGPRPWSEQLSWGGSKSAAPPVWWCWDWMLGCKSVWLRSHWPHFLQQQVL